MAAFFAGMMCGAVISWFFPVYIRNIPGGAGFPHRKTKEHVKDLNDQISIYQEDLHKLNEDNKRKLLIQSVDVKLLNGEKYKISQPDKTKFEEHVKDDISEVITKDIESVYKTKELLKRTIENKVYTINEKNMRQPSRN